MVKQVGWILCALDHWYSPLSEEEREYRLQRAERLRQEAQRLEREATT